MYITRKDSDFKSKGVRCAGWLYLPGGSEQPPVVVMAHGFSGWRSFRLADFAERFAAAGMAAFVFDYRTFGDSDGRPRNYVHPYRHVEDWEAALAHVRTLPGIDRSRIALWGTSFSGGHVIVTAARVPGISAVISQVPFVDMISIAATFRPAFIMKFLAAGVWDVLRAFTFRKEYTVPVIGDPGDFAVMNAPDVRPAFEALIPKDTAWPNAIPARLFLLPPYRPIKSAPSVKCPVLVVMARKDSIIPCRDVEKLAAALPAGRLVSFPIGHFDVYHANIEEVASAEIEFLQEKLTLPSSGRR